MTNLYKNFKKVCVLFALSLTVNAYNCNGGGYSVSVSGGQISVTGNGLNFTTNVSDYGSYYSAAVGQSDVRSLTFTPDDLNSKASLTLVKRRGTESLLLSCR